MLYKELAEELADLLEMTIEEVDGLCDSLGEIFGKIGADLDSIWIPSYGTFEPRKRSERVTVNPANGARMLIPPKLVMSFRPSSVVKRKLRVLEDNDTAYMTTRGLLKSDEGREAMFVRREAGELADENRSNDLDDAAKEVRP